MHCARQCRIHLTTHQAQLRPDRGHQNAAPKLPGSKPSQIAEPRQQFEQEAVPSAAAVTMQVDSQVYKLCMCILHVAVSLYEVCQLTCITFT